MRVGNLKLVLNHFPNSLVHLFILIGFFVGNGKSSVWIPQLSENPLYGMNYDGLRNYKFNWGWNTTTTTTATTAQPTVMASFMDPCIQDSDCDQNSTTLLHCNLNQCTCSVGRMETALGGIVVTSEWSPSLQRCEATLSSECNASGGGITCINGQECEQLPNRSTGIGCCGEGCSNDGTRKKLSLSFLFFELFLFLHYYV